MTDPNITCYMHNKVHEFLCDTPKCTNGLCSDCWAISNQHAPIMPYGIDFLCHECISINMQRSRNLNESKPSSRDNEIIEMSCPQPASAENVPTKITVEKETDNGPNDVMDSEEVMSTSSYNNVESVRKQLFPPDEVDAAHDLLSVDHIIEEDNYVNEDESVRKQLFPPDKVDAANDLLSVDHIIEEDNFVNEEPELSDLDNNDIIHLSRLTATNVPTHTPVANNTDYESFQRLYVPEWYIEAITSDDEPEAINKDIRERCWITNEMSEEIRSYYPSKDEIHINDALGDCTRDLEAFSRKCALMFPKGRIFMSYVQFTQAAKHFLEGWNCKKVGSSFKVTCFYAENRKSNKYVSKCDPCKRRKTNPSLKTQYKCPFVMRYSYLNTGVNQGITSIFSQSQSY